MQRLSVLKRLSPLALLAVFLVFAGASEALAQQSSPVGMWRTIDDETGEPRSIVEIYQEDGKLHGRVAEILKGSPDARRNAEGKIICSACDGERKGQPIEGMTILQDLERDGDEWIGGTILDPSNGNVYKAKMELQSADRLKVRGYRGVSLFGRTQTWQRVESAQFSGSGR